MMHGIKVYLLLLLFLFQIPLSGQDSTNVFTCGFDESELDLSFVKNFDARNFKVSEDGFYLARIAIDVDYDTYELFDFNEELIRFELNKMIQQVSLLYEKEIYTKLIVNEVHIWESENDNPYRNEFDVFRMLSILRTNALETKIFTEDSDFYMYLPTKNILGAGGLATGSGNVSPWGQYKTIAHEIGHNFGSPHTQSCSWENGPLDFCYPAEGTCYENALDDQDGTIMSYCTSRNATFHPEVRDLIRAYASQNLRFIDTAPSSPILENQIINTLNIPYASFVPVAGASNYYYEIALNSTFENVIFSDTVSFSTVYFDDYANFDEYYLRVKSINDYGASPWSNISKVIKESNRLATPIPDDTFNKQYFNLSFSSAESINFTPVDNAEGYEIEAINYNRDLIPVKNYYSLNFTTEVNSFLIRDASSLREDLMWRVRAYRGNEKGGWSEYQYIFVKTEDLYSNFNLRKALPTSFTIIRNSSNQTSTNFTLQKVNNDQIIDIPEANIHKEKDRFLFLNLEPNSTYKLTSQVSTDTHQPWEIKEAGIQYTFERTLSTSNEGLPSNWQLFSTEDSTTQLLSYLRILSDKYMFVQTNTGVLRYSLNENEHLFFNSQNTGGLIGNQIEMMEIDDDNNLWLFQQVSKRLDFSGVFPDPVYSLMKFNPENMDLLERFDFEYTEAGDLLSFDPNRMVFATDSRLLKLNSGRLEFYFDLAELKSSYDQSFNLDFNSDKYWLRLVPINSNESELIAINLDDLSTETFNHQKYPNCPQIFSEVFFDYKGNPLIINSANNIAFKFQVNEFITEADLTYPNGYISNLTYNNGIFTARVFSNEPGIYKYHNAEWHKLSEYPEYIFGFYDNFPDQTGNVWLNTYNTLVKLNVCSEVLGPIVNSESQVAYGNTTSINVSGCSNLNWSLNNFDGEITDETLTSKTIKPRSSFSYQISCNDNGCTSDVVEGELIVIPELSINSAVSNKVCSNDILRFSPLIQGQYALENQFSLILTNDEEQSFKIDGNEVAEGPYLLENTIPSGSYWTKLKSSHPESISQDSVLINIVKSADVTISGVFDLCNGESGNLKAEVIGSGPFNYFWADGQSQILSRDVNFAITNSGSYQLAVVDANNCTFISELITSDVIELKGNITAEGPTELAANQSVDLTVDYNADWTYTWKLNNETTNFGSDNQITVSSPGIYTVEIREGSCVFETEGIEIKQILGTQEQVPEWEIAIAPNPTEKYIHLTVPKDSTKVVKFKLISASGILLKTWESSAEKQRIDVSSLNTGIYYLQAQSVDKTSTKKLIRK